MKRMRFFISILLVMLFFAAAAQQKPHYTQYIQNQYIINPAIAGIEMYKDIRVSYRHQWLGIDDGPVTNYISMHGPLGGTKYRTVPGSMRQQDNPRGQEYWDEYKASAAHHGWGMQIVNDRTGPLSNLTAQVSYAYHLPLSDVLNLSAGFGVGISQLKLDASRLKFAVTIDPAVYTTGVLNKLRPDFSAGIYLYGPSIFAGVSAQQIVPQKIEFTVNTARTISGKSVPHLFGIAGYRMLLNDDFNLTPSVMVKFIQPAPIQVEANAKLQYRDLLWLGASYRHKDGVAGMAGLNIGPNLSIGYSYDHTVTDLGAFTRGTHEVMIGFKLSNRNEDSCPRNVW
jgi:type IX secretion system PorP/SprF family membrane protein